MHASLDSALGRQRRLNQVGESITQIAPDPAAAYSLRSLTGSDPRVVRVRRGSDNHEQDFTASQVSAGALTSFVNAQVVAPLDIQALEADGRTGDFLIAKAAYSLRSLGTRQATLAATGDTVARADGKFVAQVRRNVNGDVKSFTADEVTDGTLTSFVNESFTSSLPLDVAGSAAAAYGLRNLSSSYSGNVVEVRRSSDDTTQNFTAAEITDGTLLSFVGTGGSDDGFVSTWYDQSGNSNNATQATAASQPKIVDGGSLVSGGGLLLDGTDDFFQLSSDIVVENLPLGIFAIQDTQTSNNFTLGTSSNRGLSFDDTKIIYYLTQAQRNIDLGSTISGEKLFSVIHDGTTDTDNLKGYVNGEEFISSTDTGTQNFTNGIRFIGTRKDADSYLSGNIQELIVYTSDQSDKRRAIEESIATANGITLGSFSRDGFVKTWYDQSVTNEAGDTATGNHATQATAASQPKIVDGGSLVTGGIDFTAGESLVKTGLSISSPLNTFVVSTADVNSNGAILKLATSVSQQYRTSRKLLLQYSDLQFTSSDVYTVGEQNLQSFQFVAGTSVGFFNGTQVLSGTTAGQTVTEFRLGNAGSFGLDGKINEAILYNSDQSDNRTAIEANIGEVYSIDLPSGVDPGFDQVDGFVETWYDQSGNGRDATQATAGSQPKIVSAGALVTEGSLPTIEFDSVDDYLDSTSDISSPLWSFITHKATKNNSAVFATKSGDRWIGRRSTGTFLQVLTAVVSGGSYPSSAVIRTDEVNGSDSKIFSNGTSIATGDSGSAQSNFGRIGAQGGLTSTKFLGGNIQELIVYTSDQSANRVALETNINNQYDIY